MDCRVCNGTERLNRRCPQCADETNMRDLGPVDEYYGADSPYEEAGEDMTEAASSGCVHVCRCPSCGREETVAIRPD